MSHFFLIVYSAKLYEISYKKSHSRLFQPQNYDSYKVELKFQIFHLRLNSSLVIRVQVDEEQKEKLPLTNI